jgi:hypothetical protein
MGGPSYQQLETAELNMASNDTIIDPHDWQARAEDALEKARKMKPGPERIEAMKKAGQLRVAADLKRALKSDKV